MFNVHVPLYMIFTNEKYLVCFIEKLCCPNHVSSGNDQHDHVGHHLDRQDSHLVLLLLFSYGELLVSLEAVREECLNHPYLATIDNTEGETDDKKEDIAEDEHSSSCRILRGKIEEHNQTDHDVEL